MDRLTLKILQQMLQDFKSVFDHFDKGKLKRGSRGSSFDMNFVHFGFIRPAKV